MKARVTHPQIVSCAPGASGSLHCLFPLVSFLIVGFIGTQPLAPITRQVLTQQSDLTRQIVYGAIYVWALVLTLRRWDEQKPLFRAFLLPLVFILFCLTSILWSQFPVKVLKDTMHLFGMLLVAGIAIPYIKGDASRFLNLIFCISTGLVIVSLITIHVYPEGSIVALPYQRWRGVTIHPNSLGLAATLCIASSLTQLLSQKTLQRKFLVALILASSFVCLLASDSKTSLIIAYAIVFVLSIYVLSRIDPSSYPKLLMIIHAFLVSAVIFNFAYLLFPESFDYQKVLSSLGRSENLTGRKYLWEIGWRAFASNPIIGCGFDGLLSAQKDVFRYDLLFSQLHNGYLELLVKTGIIGAVITLAILLSYIRALTRNRSLNAEVFCFMIFLLLATVLHNLSESSIFRPNNALFVLFLCSYFTIYPLKHHDQGSSLSRLLPHEKGRIS